MYSAQGMYVVAPPAANEVLTGDSEDGKVLEHELKLLYLSVTHTRAGWSMWLFEGEVPGEGAGQWVPGLTRAPWAYFMHTQAVTVVQAKTPIAPLF